MEIIRGSRYVDERKFVYMLKGLRMKKMEGLTAVTEDTKKMERFNEAADENNFAIDLSISAILGEEQ